MKHQLFEREMRLFIQEYLAFQKVATSGVHISTSEIARIQRREEDLLAKNPILYKKLFTEIIKEQK